MAKAKKNRRNQGMQDGLVFSTNAAWSPIQDDQAAVLSVSPQLQTLYVSLDRKQRAGKPVTMVEGFEGNGMDLLQLGKDLKTTCGAGGSVKEGVILVQGDHREKVIGYLVDKGYKIKRKGG